MNLISNDHRMKYEGFPHLRKHNIQPLKTLGSDIKITGEEASLCKKNLCIIYCVVCNKALFQKKNIKCHRKSHIHLLTSKKPKDKLPQNGVS